MILKIAAKSRKSQNCYISALLPKVEEEKSAFIFFNYGLRAEMSYFVILMIASTWSQIKKMRKWPYLSPRITNIKNKGPALLVQPPLYIVSSLTMHTLSVHFGKRSGAISQRTCTHFDQRGW